MICQNCGSRAKACVCTFSQDERLQYMENAVAHNNHQSACQPLYGSCAPGLRDEISRQVDQLYADIDDAFKKAESDPGFRIYAATVAANSYARIGVLSLDRMRSGRLGQGFFCRKGLDVTIGACRECHEMWRGIDLLGGLRAAVIIENEPGAELPAWQSGWIAGRDGDLTCSFSGDEAVEWRKWHELSVDFFKAGERGEG